MTVGNENLIILSLSVCSFKPHNSSLKTLVLKYIHRLFNVLITRRGYGSRVIDFNELSILLILINDSNFFFVMIGRQIFDQCPRILDNTP